MTQCGIAFPGQSPGLLSHGCSLPPRPLPSPLLPKGKPIWPTWDRTSFLSSKTPSDSSNLRATNNTRTTHKLKDTHGLCNERSIKNEDISWDQTSRKEEHPDRSYSLVDSNCFSTKGCQDFNSMCSQQECWPINKFKTYRRSISSYKEGWWFSIRTSHWALQTLKV